LSQKKSPIEIDILCFKSFLNSQETPWVGSTAHQIWVVGTIEVALLTIIAAANIIPPGVFLGVVIISITLHDPHSSVLPLPLPLPLPYLPSPPLLNQYPEQYGV
jgi:hypothetical protein